MTRIFELGPFRLDADAALLTRDGTPTPLGPRAVAVLGTLVEHASEYVSKAKLIDAAWPGVVVEENNLAVQVAAIRRVLGDASGGNGWIETLPRRGYRFVGPIRELPDERNAGPGSRRSNLPEALTSFIGRERELVQLKRLLPNNRLVTVVGIGGIGKTRLALQAAAEVADAYRDGVWLAELGAIRDGVLVATSIAQALGIQERSGQPMAESVRAHLKSRQALLVLDNCEHLLEACAQLVSDLLRGCPNATFLATSREPLRIVGEQAYPLQSLSLPEDDKKVETLRSSEAVQLVVERIQRQLPDFVLTAARAPAVAELCIHLDGIPLALELAAARARSLSIEQINARLGDRFRLLTGGSRTALPHQQTLRATLDWSYDLLTEDERAALRRLAVFPGGFTVDAAAALVADATIDELEVIELLSQLVARSLVVADTSAPGARYRLLETTRAYAMEKLDAVGESELCRRRHAEHFRDYFDPAPEDWLHKPDVDWRNMYVPELDNLRVALDWAFSAAGDAAIGVALASASGALWSETSLRNEGRQRIDVALSCVEAGTPERELARLWFWLGWIVNAVPLEAAAAYAHAVEHYRKTDDALGLGFSLHRLGGELTYMGRVDEAAPMLAEASSLLESAGPKVLAEHSLLLGTSKMLTADFANARAHYEAAVSLCCDAGADRVAVAVLGNLADLHWMSGDLDAALAAFREAISLARNSLPARRLALALALTNFAGVLTECGRFDEALTAAREGLPVRLEFMFAWCTLDHLALRAGLTGKLPSAGRISGYVDRAYAANGSERQPNEARARNRLRALLREQLTSEEIAKLTAEGAEMTEDEACRLALEG